MKWKLKNLAEWHRWFAWHPVAVDGRVVWLETVERRIEDLLFVDRTHYRDSDGTAPAAACEDMPVPDRTAKRGSARTSPNRSNPHG